MLAGAFLNIRPSVGILHSLVCVEPSIRAVIQLVGYDAISALFILHMILVIFLIVLIIKCFPRPGFPSIQTNSDGGQGISLTVPVYS